MTDPDWITNTLLPASYRLEAAEMAIMEGADADPIKGALSAQLAALHTEESKRLRQLANVRRDIADQERVRALVYKCTGE